jgi:hypothetical protein
MQTAGTAGHMQGCVPHVQLGWSREIFQCRGNNIGSPGLMRAACYEIWRPAWVTLAAKRSQGLKICLASSP